MKELKDREYDAIVVGTGPGGATVAKELAQRNRSVLMLEWGDNEPVNGTLAQTIRNMGIPGKGALFTSDMLTMVRGITTGGSSIYYYGTAFYPPVGMLKKYNIRIEDEIEEVNNELPIAPLSDRLMGPMAKRIMNSARELGYDWKKMPKFMDQDKCRPECSKCGYGCPHGAKWTARNFVDQAREKGAALINGAKVTTVLTDNGKARGVVFRHHGTTRRAFAKQVVLAAGGIGSPLILRTLGFPDAGRNFFYDPLIAVMGTVPDMEGGREIPMASAIHMEDEGYVMSDMTLPPALYGILTSEVGRMDQLLNHPGALTIMVKAKDSLGGYLSGSGGVRKRLAESDKQKLSRGYKRAGEILRNAGAGQVFKSYFLAAHPGGTVKINELVDSNLETEIQNLFVCDCSVIPEAWGLPPTYTLLCLGKRLAKNMSKI
ncbi:MAG: GMC family oxidoreductase [Desulfobacteraceae bacterium]|nr:GMC family oxidoreductase [Desulfobacteraceae bacterium]